MEKHDSAVETAGRLYENGFNCCESVVRAVCGYRGCTDEAPLRISTPFGGGFAGHGAACGSLVAAFLCLGYFRGRTAVTGSGKDAAEPSSRIFAKFRERFGSHECGAVLGYDRKDPKAVELHAARVKREVCVPLTKEVTRWILEELDGADER